MSCKACEILAQRVEELEAVILKRDEEILELRSEIVDVVDAIRISLNISYQQALIIAFIASRNQVKRRAMRVFLYGLRSEEKEEPAYNVIDVQICRLRKILPKDIKLYTLPSGRQGEEEGGYYMDTEGKEALQKHVRKICRQMEISVQSFGETSRTLIGAQ